jgi:hypothetical protein
MIQSLWDWMARSCRASDGAIRLGLDGVIPLRLDGAIPLRLARSRYDRNLMAFLNPKGIPSSSPGLLGTSYPGELIAIAHQPCKG